MVVRDAPRATSPHRQETHDRSNDRHRRDRHARVAKTQDYLEDAGADIYGQYVFHEAAQRQYLAKPIFEKLRRTIEGHEPFDPAIVDAVAHGVKEWALAQGATHYTHWFVPMTGSTAEKHDSFLTPDRRRPRRSPSSPARTSSRASRTPARSRRAASGPRSRRAATPPGTSPRRSSCRSSPTA